MNLWGHVIQSLSVLALLSEFLNALRILRIIWIKNKLFFESNKKIKEIYSNNSLNGKICEKLNTILISIEIEWSLEKIIYTSNDMNDWNVFHTN